MTTHDKTRHPYGIDRLEEWRKQGTEIYLLRHPTEADKAVGFEIRDIGQEFVPDQDKPIFVYGIRLYDATGSWVDWWVAYSTEERRKILSNPSDAELLAQYQDKDTAATLWRNLRAAGWTRWVASE